MFEMAQKCGLLFELDALCRLAALRGASGKLPAGKKLFLNCSARVMDDPRFRHDQLRQALETCGLEPKDLVFEFSEHECVRSPKAVRETRETLRSLGVQVALDDAGAASPSLGAVLELDPDYVKIDISLVRSVDTDIGRQELMQLIQGVAEKLGAKIIAEGVETADEVATLQRIGITLGQGYLLGMPDSLA
jgi:EAL domain-containing protein (putative c-di-GMP-specific phosphodiesterase class I)